ncbi:MAG: hypothetical protein D3907_14935, partial [Candidatus Electrothrix sp. AUS3]|nr:hypothetical protein [Candidatus Electrothrix gigas]
MSYNPDIHHRRSIRLQGYDYAQAGAYFLTVCTHARECLFGKITDGEIHLNDAGRIVTEEWLKTPVIRTEIELDEWVVMPNHFHGIAVITDADVRLQTDDRFIGRCSGRQSDRPTGQPPDAPTGSKPKSVGAMIAGFKSSVTSRVNVYRQSPGSKVWQRNYWDHIIRNETELDALRR